MGAVSHFIPAALLFRMVLLGLVICRAKQTRKPHGVCQHNIAASWRHVSSAQVSLVQHKSGTAESRCPSQAATCLSVCYIT